MTCYIRSLLEFVRYEIKRKIRMGQEAISNVHLLVQSGHWEQNNKTL